MRLSRIPRGQVPCPVTRISSRTPVWSGTGSIVIDDGGPLRHGATVQSFAGDRAPSTPGLFFVVHPGNVRQAEKPAESLPQARNRPRQGKHVLRVLVKRPATGILFGGLRLKRRGLDTPMFGTNNVIRPERHGAETETVAPVILRRPLVRCPFAAAARSRLASQHRRRFRCSDRPHEPSWASDRKVTGVDGPRTGLLGSGRLVDSRHWSLRSPRPSVGARPESRSTS